MVALTEGYESQMLLSSHQENYSMKHVFQATLKQREYWSEVDDEEIVIQGERKALTSGIFDCSEFRLSKSRLVGYCNECGNDGILYPR